MKKSLILLLLFAATLVGAKELKVLMVGNSFSLSVLEYLPKLVVDSGKHKLKLATTYIGGCPMERHLKNLADEATQPDKKPYAFYVIGKRTVSSKLSDAIKSDKWDIISIQQASPQSINKEKTHADAEKLIAAIRELAPQAEIIIQQTWSYRADHPWFTRKDAKLDQTKMYNLLNDNYKSLAKKYNFRLVPVGDAVQNYRASLAPFQIFSDEELIKKITEEKFDASCGDIVGTSRVRTDKKTGTKKLSHDRIHLNRKGQFLQACVWYMFLFDEKAEDIKFIGEMADMQKMKDAATKAINDLKK